VRDLGYLLPGNRGLLAATAGLALVLGTAWLGPLGSRLGAALEARERKVSEFERWQQDFRGYRPIDPGEREVWRRSFQDLLTWVPQARDEPQLVTEVARAVQTPSTKDLQVLRGETREDREDALPEELELPSPLGGESVRLRAVPLLLQFRCAHGDLLGLLGKLQRKEIPARLDALQLKRLFGDIEVRMELVFFVRAGATP
jgi:hypothetical protein